ncbi:MAG TPA: PAS domain S-box protein, partial [Stellaceae bacterium]|nr:PAS domain S-box protein [Stellaceae bacterium]
MPGYRGSFGLTCIPPRIAAGLRSLAHYSGAVLGLCTVALLWVGIYQFVAADKERAELSAVQSTTNFARAFEEHIIRSIQAIDQTLLYVRDSYARDPAHFDLARWSREAFLPDPGSQIGIIDKDGYLLATSITTIPGPIDVSDREHFQFHAHTARDELFISKPVFLRANNVWSIQLTRRINAPDGAFAGVVTASLDPNRLARFYESVDLGTKGSTALVGIDGIVRARAALGNTAVGQSLANSKLFAFYAARTMGTFIETSPIDGIERIYSYRAVRGYPLIVSVGLAREEVLAAYDERRKSYLEEGGALSLLLLAISALIAWHQHKSEKSREHLRASEERYRSLMRTATEGIHILDCDGNLIEASPSFYEMLGYPIGTPLRVPDWDVQFTKPEIQREIAQLLEAPKSFDTRHRRKDGSIIDVEISAHRFVLEGRTLLYNSAHDITQRKTYEAKLRESEQQYRNAAFEA